MSEVDNKVKMIVEGLLLAAGRPLTLDNIAQVFSEEEAPEKAELLAVMTAIDESCGDRGFELKETASGYRFQVKQELSEWIGKLWEERPPRYTRALLETLALVAYRQPLTRGDIEEIRGVGVSSNIIRTLLDREWIRVVGHRDVPGRPAMFATTKQFLDYFNLKSLQELPALADIKDLAEKSEELDLDDGSSDSRVLDLPEEATDENAFELQSTEEERLAEEAALELSKKPLDEILAEGLGISEEDIEDEDEDEDEEGASADVLNQAFEAGEEALDTSSQETDEDSDDQFVESEESEHLNGQESGAESEPSENASDKPADDGDESWQK
ncbi:MAG: SMC-Scp complex subunit ScpB [Pseudohongiellaceae bacterium]